MSTSGREGAGVDISSGVKEARGMDETDKILERLLLDFRRMIRDGDADARAVLHILEKALYDLRTWSMIRNSTPEERTAHARRMMEPPPTYQPWTAGEPLSPPGEAQIRRLMEEDWKRTERLAAPPKGPKE